MGSLTRLLHRSSLCRPDDHLPFLHRGVPVVHMIPVPFPVVWHTLAVRALSISTSRPIRVIAQDDASSLDFPTLKTWSIILRTVVSEYLALNQQDGTVVEERSSTSSAKGNREELVRRHGVRRWRALLTSVGAAVGALV